MTPQDNTPKEQQPVKITDHAFEPTDKQGGEHLCQICGLFEDFHASPDVPPVRHEAARLDTEIVQGLNDVAAKLDPICQREGCGKKRSDECHQRKPGIHTYHDFLPPTEPEGKDAKIIEQNEILRLSGLLRISNTERNDANFVARDLRERLATAEQERDTLIKAREADHYRWTEQAAAAEKAESDLTAALKRADDAEAKLTAARASDRNQIAALRDALQPLANNYGHWLAGMSEGDKHKSATFQTITWKDAERAYRAITDIKFPPVLSVEDVRPVVEACQDHFKWASVGHLSNYILDYIKAKMGVQG